MGKKFKATHIINWNDLYEMEVMAFRESDGSTSFFSGEEWYAYAKADWTLDLERGLLFKGQAPVGQVSLHRIKEIRSGKEEGPNDNA